jgi:hypothetical protein
VGDGLKNVSELLEGVELAGAHRGEWGSWHRVLQAVDERRGGSK